MEQHYWWLFALLQPIGFAFSTLVNQIYKKPGSAVVSLRSTLVLLALLPFTFFVEMPSQPIFYIASFTAAILAFIADSLIMNSSAKFGAGTTSRILPMAPLGGFILWLIVHPESFYKFLDYPAISAAIVLSLLTCSYAISHLQKCDISKKALIYLLPVIVCFSINDVMNKTAQDNSGLMSGVVWYTFFLSIISILSGTLVQIKNKTLLASLKDKDLLKAGFFVGIFYFIAIMGRNLSMVYTENPAYTSIIAGGAPLILFVYHKIFNIEDKANVKAGLLFTAGVLSLIFFASYIK